MAAVEERVQTGTFCSTSGSYFQDKEALAAHYKSDFHRYNLKRKLANLPPVTKEWFEARREQLAASQAAAGGSALAPGATRFWVDPQTRKNFKTEHTYLAHTRSKKFLDALRKAGLQAPPPPTILTLSQKQSEEAGGGAGGGGDGAAASAAAAAGK